MKIFRRKKTPIYDSDDILGYDADSGLADSEDYDKKRLLDNLTILRQQIAEARLDYERTLNDLAPLKWEVLEKRRELEQIKIEYNELQSKIARIHKESEE